MRELEIYIHIPFCVKKCDYCDFVSFPASYGRQEAYVNALKKEIAAFSPDGFVVSSIFFGGGTPSIVPAGWIAELMDLIRSRFYVKDDAEITIEANPGTVNREKMLTYKSAGINRISFGCQSADDAELLRLGRIHTYREFLQSFRLARDCGFANISVDLMSGLPDQTKESWERSLRLIAALGPEHISAYSLILEEGTEFWRRRDSLHLPDEDTERFMYEDTERTLRLYGYHQYEISNYAKEGFECRHNLGYWTGTEYIGFGIAAASMVGDVRFRNTDDLDVYLACGGDPERIRTVDEILKKKDRMAETMILGLRLTRGVSEEEFYRRYGRRIEDVYGDVVSRYESAGLLERADGCVRLTRRGLSLSNVVMADFLQTEGEN